MFYCVFSIFDYLKFFLVHYFAKLFLSFVPFSGILFYFEDSDDWLCPKLLRFWVTINDYLWLQLYEKCVSACITA